MNEIIVINGQSVEFEVADSGVFATSLDVAQVFEKRHADIIAKIAEFPNDEFRERNFSLTERTAKFGAVMRSEPYYKITRDGFSLLVMGFTGEKAYRWKIEFIKAFNLMEAELNRIKTAQQSSSLNLQSKFAEILSALKEKSSQADEFKQKYYESLENEVVLLRQVANQSKKEAIYNTKLSQAEKENIIKLYKSGLSQAEICRQTNRSDAAVRNAIRGAL
ncbi:Rha family transcriptional regulator [Campylobacter porcelli]|uniref:Phage regulatory protein, Rha family n=1 Tax=Campylobacter porcelli TaxID=1660073 RepID=A0A1X9SVN4_9BACT|nr:Rha family transcriptional regulator [Campylobacter sp. RM6137]ARR00310.1 phage regulatory protein, Rha family [Campylobacter sp. RM6137]